MHAAVLPAEDAVVALHLHKYSDGCAFDNMYKLTFEAIPHLNNLSISRSLLTCRFNLIVPFLLQGQIHLDLLLLSLPLAQTPRPRAPLVYLSSSNSSLLNNPCLVEVSLMLDQQPRLPRSNCFPLTLLQVLPRLVHFLEPLNKIHSWRHQRQVLTDHCKSNNNRSSSSSQRSSRMLERKTFRTCVLKLIRAQRS